VVHELARAVAHLRVLQQPRYQPWTVGESVLRVVDGDADPPASPVRAVGERLGAPLPLVTLFDEGEAVGGTTGELETIELRLSCLRETYGRKSRRQLVVLLREPCPGGGLEAGEPVTAAKDAQCTREGIRACVDGRSLNGGGG